MAYSSGFAENKRYSVHQSKTPFGSGGIIGKASNEFVSLRTSS